ncbi:MMPL family transporter [Nocardia sp. alder85J]|uniref:MMPL family transporter n=1 Tax=Nocardia sp. alder85J TaxID=2862949 RepID=UPI001CD7FA35|nr:MMPL family transporter [Nocardia sp. alder85J]MCX4091826.1 MMPL family transporter [Nocardia sp. alder85J]
MRLWDRYAALVSGRRSWTLLVVLLVAAAALMGLVGGNGSAGRAPDSLPPSADSATVKTLLRQFPDGGTTTAVAVLTRTDGGILDAADHSAAAAALHRMRGATADSPKRPQPAPAAEPHSGPAAGSPADLSTGTQSAPSAGIQPGPTREPGSAQGAPPTPAFGTDLALAPDQRAVVGPIPIPADLDGFALTDRIREVRAAGRDGLPAGLRLEVTGGPAFGADIADSFSGANVLLLSITALVVAVLLIATYRSPVLWLIPLVVVAVADRVAGVVGTGLAGLTGLSFDGSTSGITSVLVFGAGTNYALLLVSRYRDELHREADHRRALRQAVRRAGPAVLASNVTVVLALLTLLLATLPNTRSLGLLAAAGLVVALVFVLFGLPPALALVGRKAFWPLVPEVDGRDAAEIGPWHRVAQAVVRRAAPVAAGTLLALLVCAAALPFAHIGLAQADRFRVRAESITGLDTLAAHFPSGASDPTIVLARPEAADAVSAVLARTPGVTRAVPTGVSAAGTARWTVTLDAPPSSAAAFSTIRQLRSGLAGVPDAAALVGGSDAQALDTRDAAGRDRSVVIPFILAVVLLVLLAVLRAVPAAVLLVAVTVLSALAALGLGSWLSAHVFGFPALDVDVPLFAFLFLVALGVDYTIFLVTRAREETAAHGTTGGIVRAVSATGAVITSAGIVLAAVFCVLGVLPLITLTQLGIVVGLGILLDTFVVRTVVIPALFRLIGPRIWWPALPARRHEPDYATVSR